ncbi:helix-turn-helix domain-containing protein [Streptomyces baarnensis]|uniref:helix-turn-helix domain-containing protein n=1 Tax=Streptomyces baarnensis TaxID=66872 RepID=UPI001F1FCDA9|nr:transposase family protein [Streptomyces baarnensis]
MHRFAFVDRLLTTLVHLRHGATHDVLACWFGVDRSTITRANGEIRPLPAERVCTISPCARLRTLAEVIDHLGAVARSASSTAPGSESAGRPPDARTATCSFPARASRAPTRPWSSPTKMGRCCSAARPDGQLRGQHPLPPVGPRSLPTPATRASAPRPADAWSPHPTAPQVQEERPGQVGENARATAQGTLLTTDPARARHRPPEEPAGAGPPLGCREHISDTVQAVAGLLSCQQTVGLGPRDNRGEHQFRRRPGRFTAYRVRARKGCPVPRRRAQRGTASGSACLRLARLASSATTWPIGLNWTQTRA